MIDDERVGGSRLWLLSVGAAAGVLQVTGGEREEQREGPLPTIRGDIF